MSIQAGNLQTFKADTMADTPDGGGELTSQLIAYGAANNIFENVSSGDRVTGAAHLRKIYQHVTSQNTDAYLKGRAILTHTPSDEKVDVTMFSTGSNHDRRDEARSKIEGYRSKGAKYNGFLYATQYEGSKVVTIFQAEDALVPLISDVYYLSQNNHAEHQYIKVTDVVDEVQTFTMLLDGAVQTFKRRIIELSISQRLKYNFEGAEVSALDDLNPPATILTTVLSEAAQYYSSRKSAEAATAGDTSIKVESIYSQLVPSSLRESGTANVDPIQNTKGLVRSSSVPIVISSNITFDAGMLLVLGTPIYPSTLDIQLASLSLIDKRGRVLDQGVEVGTVDYEKGEILFDQDSPSYGGTKQISFIAGAPVESTSRTSMIEVTSGNRGTVYSITILPVPQRGSLRLDFISFDNWYSLFDDSTGTLQARQDGIGSATIDYDTGAFITDLEVLPDVGGALILTWGGEGSTLDRSDLVLNKPYFSESIALGHTGSTSTIAWSHNGAKVATVDAAGVISGDAAGTLTKDGVLEMTPSTLPPKGTSMLISTTNHNVINEDFSQLSISGNSALKTDGIIAGTINNAADILAGTVVITWEVWNNGFGSWIYPGNEITVPIRAIDDGSGNLQVNGITVGTINYVTGAFTIDPTITKNMVVFDSITVDTGIHLTDGSTELRTYSPAELKVGNSVLTLKGTIPVNGTVDITNNLKCGYSVAGAAVSLTKTSIMNALLMPLGTSGIERISEGSLRFDFAGRAYMQEGESKLRSELNLTTGASTDSGSVDKTTGIVSIEDWPVNASSLVDPILYSLATYGKVGAVSQLVMRVPNSPVKLESFHMRATEMNGTTLYTGSADASGDITGDFIEGALTYNNGIVQVRFGEWIADNVSYVGEWWYRTQDVVGGMVFKPVLVDSNSIKYDAVVQNFIPIDSEIIGLDAVRLPEDGRVPVFNTGDQTVVMNTQVVSQTFTSNSQTDLGRTNLKVLTVTDDNGLLVVGSAYTFDLDAGTVDWGDLTQVAQPIVVSHRVEDELIIEDVQVTGDITFNGALSHEYPVAGTIVCSSIPHGDMFAYVDNIFTQKTWTGEWADTAIGSDTLAKYNDANYPILVTNDSCVDERWLILFKTSTTVDVIGERKGVVAEGVSITAPISPINPLTGYPYFTIPAAGWGLGWDAGNVSRFETVGAYASLWLIESIDQGAATDTSDDALRICTEFRGDVSN